MGETTPGRKADRHEDLVKCPYCRQSDPTMLERLGYTVFCKVCAKTFALPKG